MINHVRVGRVLMISAGLVMCILAALYVIGISAPPPQAGPSREATPPRGVLARPAVRSSSSVEADPVSLPAPTQKIGKGHPIDRPRVPTVSASPPTPPAASDVPNRTPLPGHRSATRPPARTAQPVAQDPMPDSSPDRPTGADPRQPASEWSIPRYRVQVGVFDDRKEAKALVSRLEGLGYAASMVGGYPAHVCVGGLLDRRTAEDLRTRLQAAGFQAELMPL